MRKIAWIVAVAVMGLCLAGAAWSQEKPAAGQEKEKPAAVAADPLTGEYDGTVDMQDGAMPFSLKLKLEKDKVTGEVGSQQGAVPITDGSFADGKLSISFNYVDGAAVLMTGTLTDGQLAGSLNYGGGQMVVSWAAKKKPAK